MQASVFVSRPAIRTRDQEAAYARWLAGLTALDLAFVTIPRAAYSPSPWRQLREAVRRVHGMVVLGFNQAVVELGHSRPRADVEQSAAAYATPWNHIEAGLGVMAELPLLVVRDGDVHDGVFTGDVWRDGVFGAEMDVWSAGEGADDPTLCAWLADVRQLAESPPTSRPTDRASHPHERHDYDRSGGRSRRVFVPRAPAE